MQVDLFGNEIKPKVEKLKPVVTTSDYNEDDKYTKEYCLNEISKDPYLWDMRCWKKSRYEHSKQDVIDWIYGGCEPNNCGHTVFCIEWLREHNWATVDEIAEVVLSNKIIQYPNEIGTWDWQIDENESSRET